MDSGAIKKIAHLSRLALTEQEVEEYGKSLSDILGYVDKLQECDTQNTPEYKIAHLHKTSVRPDAPADVRDSDLPANPQDYRQLFLANAPDVKGKSVVVRKVIET